MINRFEEQLMNLQEENGKLLRDKKKNKGNLVISLALVFLLGIVVFALTINLDNVVLNFDTGNLVCQKLAQYEGNYSISEIEAITSKSKKGELICQFPSYDSTHLIKFQGNTER